MNSVLRNPCNLYTAGWILYYLQGTLYTYGDIFAKVLLFLLIAYSLVFVVNNKKLYGTSYFRIMFYIFLLLVIYTGFYYISGETFVHGGVARGKFEMLKNVTISFAPICCYYGYARKGYLTESWFKYGALALLLSAVASFYWEQSYRLSLAIAEGSTREEFTNNTGYLFAAIVPMLVLIKSKSWYKYTLLVVAFIYALFAMKRGALLVIAVASLMFIWSNLKRGTSFRKIVVLLFSIASLWVIYYGVTYMMETSDYFLYRLEQTQEGSSSGRDVMYSEMLRYFINDAPFFTVLFGRGIDGTGFLFGYGAHNDWIEFAIDFGLLGLSLYFIYWVRLYKTWRVSKPFGYVAAALGMIVVSEFLKSLFSFSINDIPIQLAPTFGYCLALVEMYKSHKFGHA